MGSVNVDLIYGLPHQTRAGFADTVERVLDIRPERVALFHYAHVPWMKSHQSAMDVDAMPGAAEKLDIFSDAIAAFDAAGYVYLGLDHFALPDDELSLAAKEGTLHRNFMGYTMQRGREMVSLGVSSIGEIDGVYVQNIANEPEYASTLAPNADSATYRGHDMSAEDELRRDVILELMCNGRIESVPPSRSATESTSRPSPSSSRSWSPSSRTAPHRLLAGAAPDRDRADADAKRRRGVR